MSFRWSNTTTEKMTTEWKKLGYSNIQQNTFRLECNTPCIHIKDALYHDANAILINFELKLTKKISNRKDSMRFYKNTRLNRRNTSLTTAQN